MSRPLAIASLLGGDVNQDEVAGCAEQVTRVEQPVLGDPAEVFGALPGRPGVGVDDDRQRGQCRQLRRGLDDAGGWTPARGQHDVRAVLVDVLGKRFPA
ncbi:hypothetical protein A5733_03400 [Mycobacterium sp. NS-7484]|nr:hypothetical protein A5733_03400 [Mycobacterium sp. NS-7484]